MSRDVFSIGEQIQVNIIEDVPQPYESYVTIYEFFDVLYSMFDGMNLLAKEGDLSDDKIRLLDEFPDEQYMDNDCVVFSLGERKYQTFKSIGAPSYRTQVKPSGLKSGHDLVSNNIKTDYCNRFDNEVKLTVYSSSLKRVHQICGFVESVLFKNKGYLQKYVDKIVFEGQTSTQHHNEYSSKRIFSRSINLQVITSETYSLVTEELKYIKK